MIASGLCGDCVAHQIVDTTELRDCNVCVKGLPLAENVTVIDRTAVSAPVMLVVGDLRGWRRAGRRLPLLSGFHFAGYGDVTAAALERIRPDVILSALFGSDFDALELARRLSELGFAGRYRALAMALPDPAVIRAEVWAVAPGLDFDLFLIDGTALALGR